MYKCCNKELLGKCCTVCVVSSTSNCGAAKLGGPKETGKEFGFPKMFYFYSSPL